jgi:MoaA/NifB/PqqE/SkfB family radical SAM enzyme
MHATTILMHEAHGHGDSLRRAGEIRKGLAVGGAGSPRPERLLETSLASFVRDAVRVALRAPSLLATMLRFARGQRNAARVRASWEARGTHVPPLMIASITETCNLRCRGCYAMVHRGAPDRELSDARWRGLFLEASRLGISFVLVAGGEPFSRPEVIEAAASTPDTLYAVFTNGLLIGPRTVSTLRRDRNVVPVISLEGPEHETDGRRGTGVYRRVMQAMARLRAARVTFGASLTVTSDNLDVVTAPAFVRSLTDAGARIVFFVEFTPVEPGTEALALSEAQRTDLRRRVDAFHAERRALFVAFPGDEERYGGCLAAGRGFIHVDPQGRLEPCPFAPYSDTSVRGQPLAEALGSPLLAAIRENHSRLTETRGGCALWAERDWVRSLLPGGAAESEEAQAG